MKIETKFLDDVKKIYGEEDARKVLNAFEYASKIHEGQVRDSGEEYISHPYRGENLGRNARRHRNCFGGNVARLSKI